jgi:hypothetical protein
MKKVIKNKRIFFTILILIFLSVIFFIYNSQKNKEEVKGCQIDSDCIPVSCCHPNSCVLKEQRPNCGGIFCSMSCEGLLDCGKGHCGCANNKCDVIQD